MAENIFASFDISGQGMSVQRMRLAATANNIANVNTTKGPSGAPYQRQVVLTRGIPRSQFNVQLENQIGMLSTSREHIGVATPKGYPSNNQVLESKQAVDNSPPRLVYEPNHPDADENGYVKYPDINIMTEMVEMISAQRSFQANTGVIQAAKNIARDSLDI